MQITLFTGVIESVFVFSLTSTLAKLWPKCQGHLVLKPGSENLPTFLFFFQRMCWYIIFLNSTSAVKKYYAPINKISTAGQILLENKLKL